MPENATLEDVAKLVHDLKEQVDALPQNADPVTEESVRRIAEELIETQKQAIANDPNARRGFRPDDSLPEGDVIPQTRVVKATGAERLALIQSMPAKRVADQLRRPVADVQAFHEASDNVFLLDALCQARGGRDGLPKDVRETDYYQSEFVPLVQAMDSATAAEGLEFIPTLYSASLIDRINLQLRVVALLGPIVPMPSNPWKIPGRAVSRQRLAKGAENTADTGQTNVSKRTPGTRNITLTAVKFWGEALVSKEAEEDSIIAMLPFIQEEMVDYLAADQEDSVLNGDTTGTHQDSDVTASDDPRKNWNGLRKLAPAGAKVDVSNAAPTVANTIRAVRKKMGKYGVDPTQLVHICSIAAYIQLLADSNVITMEKYGPNATIVTGELGRADGSPIVVSEYVRQDLNATGVFDNTTTNRTEIVSVFTRGFMLGSRRDVEIQVLRELYAEADQDALMISLRRAFVPRYPVASENIVGVSYNIAA